MYVQGFHQVLYQGIVKATGSGVLEDLTFTLLAVSAKLRQPTGKTQDNFNFGPSLLKF